MAHYNIYDDLGIDRNLESSRIVNLIDERLSSTPRDNVADFDRLTTSRHLFEDDSRRSAYDKALDDPDHPDITIGSFRAFADGTYSTQSTKASAQASPWPASQLSAPGSTFSTPSSFSNSPTFSDSTPPSSPSHQASAGPLNSLGAASHSEASWNPNRVNLPSPAATSTHMGALPNNETGIIPDQPASAGFDLRTLAVPPSRKRTQSLMWLIGWGIILFPWLILPLIYLFGGPSESASLSEAFDHEATLLAIAVFTLLHTAAMLVLLNFVWHLRIYLGRKLK
ncbi:hypothetical protein [Corynebacterium auriscanis]|uniref:hypothetical protein n=1 Tax=Corynebacterium auriscanis TaxID=99807 RepID=UPI0025B49E48|nr:hypothetical protein [Corynebacterium auriscanis]WJY71950.1 hypothetical protein CAURIC_01360 [Corynebacterium auriscanis]